MRIQWRLSTILKASKKVYEITFLWYVQVCILWRCIQYTIYWDKTQMLKIFPSGKIIGTKHALFSLSRAPIITLLLLSWNTWFVSQAVCGIFHFPFRFAFIKFYILVQQNAWTLKRHDFFQNWQFCCQTSDF